MWRSLAVGLLVVTGAAGCVGPPSSLITTNQDHLRVFTWVSEWQGVLMDCGIPVAGGGVRGRLEGSPTDALEPVWLRSEQDQKLSVVWPAGFSVTFGPDVLLYDERGYLAARAGETVALPDVEVGTASGSYDDPYIARSRVFDGCYAFVD